MAGQLGGLRPGLPGVGRVEGFDLGRDALVFARSTLTSPAQLYVARPDGSGARELFEAALALQPDQLEAREGLDAFLSKRPAAWVPPAQD